MKKSFKNFGIFLTLLLCVLVAVPLFINVDRYRPQIEDLVNQRIQGKIELGKLSLSLWGQLRVDIAGLKLLDASKKEILGVQNAYFHLPLISVLSGSPVLTLKMKEPVLNVVKNRSGEINLFSLVARPSGTSVDTGNVPTSPVVRAVPSSLSVDQSENGNLKNTPKNIQKNIQKNIKDESSAFAGFVSRSHLGIEVTQAQIKYSDESSGLITDVKNLNLILRDLSFTYPGIHPVQLEVWTNLDSQMSQVFSIRGPVRLQGQAQGGLITADLELGELEIKAGEAFEKKKGTHAHARLALSVLPEEIKIETFKFGFLDSEINAQGTIKGLTSNKSPELDLHLTSNSIRIGSWSEVIPRLKNSKLEGIAQLSAKLTGTFLNPASEMSLSFVAPENDLKARGSLVSFPHPQLELQINSSGIDLDRLMERAPPVLEKVSATQKVSNQSSAPAVATAPKPHVGEVQPPADSKKQATREDSADYDAQLSQIRANPFFNQLGASVGVQITKFKLNGIQVDQINCKLSLKNLVAGLNSCSLKMDQGEIHSSVQLQLKPKIPTYQMHLDIQKLDLARAAESQGTFFKNTMKGIGSFQTDVKGASFNANLAKKNLNATGRFKVNQAEFATFDVMKMVKETLDKTLEKIAERVPGIKDKKIGSLPVTRTIYDEISSDFSIANEVFLAPNFIGKASPQKGIDLKGKTKVGIKDYSLDADWELTDTYNLTHLRDVSIEQSGIKVDQIFSENNLPVHFPIHLGCTLSSPCTSSIQVPEYLVGVALKNIGKKLSAEVKEKLVNQAKELLKQAPDDLKDQLKRLFH